MGHSLIEYLAAPAAWLAGLALFVMVTRWVVVKSLEGLVSERDGSPRIEGTGFVGRFIQARIALSLVSPLTSADHRPATRYTLAVAAALAALLIGLGSY
jgi:hypothetical protein